ncbi:MAG: glycosyltransferase family 4 protein [Methanobacterium sp.]|uniref:glycosyltransferase family 4 protein n=1 Tax=Methanobacterium sp. TaxID=2164 RepID=UPI003D653906|nr:glycosyltransferase family 4 protein [Methanobacterium sp.]
MIKVLFTTHQTGFNVMGGAEIQMLKTMQSINKLYADKVEVKFFDVWNDKLENYDIIHIFNPMAFPCEALRIAEYAREKNIRVIISPIFYEYIKKENNVLSSIFERFMRFFSIFKRYIATKKRFEFLDNYKDVEKAFINADLILPNTEIEKNRLLSKFPNINADKYLTVPNATDSKFKYGDPKCFNDNYGIDNFILFVGRVETRKNVLGLIKAFVKSNLDTKLVIIGKIHEKEYYELCKEEANENVVFLSPLNNDSEILRSAYKAAKVLALPSYYETPGLAALEAGLSGLNIVITRYGGTKEYFKDYVLYVDPENDENIKNALISAYNTPKSDELSEYIENNFTWNIIAKKMVEIYESFD